jgi:hypothetical protein
MQPHHHDGRASKMIDRTPTRTVTETDYANLYRPTQETPESSHQLNQQTRLMNPTTASIESGFYLHSRNEGVDLRFPVSVHPFLLPLVDEFVVAVGQGQRRGTLAGVQAMGDPKIRIDAGTNACRWGFVYVTNVVLLYRRWAFYTSKAMKSFMKMTYLLSMPALITTTNTEVEALVFDYRHFYGTADWVSISWLVSTQDAG